jgi:hypothetical protein
MLFKRIQGVNRAGRLALVKREMGYLEKIEALRSLI